MTNPLFKKLNTATQDIRLSDNERASMRAALLAHMEESAAPALSLKPTKTPYSFVYLPRMVAYVLLPLVLVLGAGGTSFAAADSLPGDLLYPVKISVNEQVESALAFSPTAKAQVHVALAGKRLEEAQALAMSGKLNATTTAQIQSNLEEHTNEAKALSKSVAIADPGAAAEISAQLTSSLSANNAVLEDVGDSSTNEGIRADAHELADAVRQHVSGTEGGDGSRAKGSKTAALAPVTLAVSATSSGSTTSTSATSSTSTSSPKKKTGNDTASALRAGKKAANELSQAIEVFKDTKSSIDANTAAEVQSQFAALQTQLDHGNAALGTGDTVTASHDFTHAYSSIIRLETLLRAAKRLGGKVLEPLLRQPISSDTPEGSVLGTSTEASSTLQISTTSTSSSTTTTSPATTTIKGETKKKNRGEGGHSFVKDMLERITH